MQEYPVKRGYTKGLQERMVEGIEKFFETAPEESNGHFTIQYGALARLEVFTGANGKSLVVDTKSDRDLDDDEVILDTNRRFRKYLEYVTGFNAKERAKKMKKVEEK